MGRVEGNIVSEQEWESRPSRAGGSKATDGRGGAVGDAAPLELGPSLAAVAVGLLLLEWIVYCGRIRAV